MAAVITIFVLFAYLFVGSCVGAYESTWNATKVGNWYGPTPTVPAR